MNTCPNCGKIAGLHSSILQGCMCQYSMQAPPQRTEQEPVKYSDYEPDGVHHNKPPQRKPLTKDRTMEIANQTAGQYWMDEAHIQRFRAAVEADHGIQENT